MKLLVKRTTQIITSIFVAIFSGRKTKKKKLVFVLNKISVLTKPNPETTKIYATAQTILKQK